MTDQTRPNSNLPHVLNVFLDIRFMSSWRFGFFSTCAYPSRVGNRFLRDAPSQRLHTTVRDDPMRETESHVRSPN